MRRLSILIYHRVLERPDPLMPDAIDAARFEQHLSLLARWFNVLPLHEAARRLDDGSLPARAACITFDDGYADNADVALPMLQRHGLHATFFIASGFLDGGIMWNDALIEMVRAAKGDSLALPSGRIDIGSTALRRMAIEGLLGEFRRLPPAERAERVARLAGREGPSRVMLRSDQVRALHLAGMEIGAHTVNHPILACIDPNAALKEIADGKQQLECLIDAPVRLFAYPNGKPEVDYGECHVKMVRELGFAAAVATNWGAARADTDLYQLPRFTPWDRSATRFLLRMEQNLFRRAA